MTQLNQQQQLDVAATSAIVVNALKDAVAEQLQNFAEGTRQINSLAVMTQRFTQQQVFLQTTMDLYLTLKPTYDQAKALDNKAMVKMVSNQLKTLERKVVEIVVASDPDTMTEEIASRSFKESVKMIESKSKPVNRIEPQHVNGTLY